MNQDNPRVKPIIAFTRGNKIYMQRNHETIRLQDLDALTELVKNQSSGLIIKPYTGGGGSRISKVWYKNEKLHFEGACRSYDDFQKVVLNVPADFLMTEFIDQTGFSKTIYPHTLNTVRILTMTDPDTGRPFVARAVQRFGTKRSRVVDNFTAGGISVHVDTETGKRGKGACFIPEEGLQWYTHHPDTKVRFSGERIDHWGEIIDYVLYLSSYYFYLPYIGWDVVPMEDGFFILEGNTNSDVNLLQIHGGLLKNPKIKIFYQYHGVI